MLRLSRRASRLAAARAIAAVSPGQETHAASMM